MALLVHAKRLVPGLLAWVLVTLIAAPSARAQTLEPRQQNVVVYHEDTEELPALGPRYAPVTMEFFLGLESSRDLNAYRHMRTLASRHPDRLRVIIHLRAAAGRSDLAEAALEAHAQGKFLAFMDELTPYSRRRRRVPQKAEYVRTLIENLCATVGVDHRRVLAALEDRRHWATIEGSELVRRRRRVPERALILLVNGVPSSLRSSEVMLTKLEELYDQAYATARTKLEAGVAIEDLYHLLLIEADASIEPIRINAGLVSGDDNESRPSVLDDAPLVDPRAKVGGYRLGPENARITIHLYCDFSPRFKPCRETRAALESVRVYFPGLVRVFFHHALPPGLDEEEREALIAMHAAGSCAERQGAFEQFYQQVYIVPLRTRRRRRVIDPQGHMTRVYESLDVDQDALRACIDDPEVTGQVEAEARAVREAGITTSPTVVVGDRVYPGSKTSEEIIRLIEIELMPGLLERLAPSPPGTPDWLTVPEQ